jgi:nucleoside-diphosphate-sugar epimerase
MATAAASLVDVAVRFAGRQPRFREQVRVLVAPSVCDGARFARATGFRPEVGLEDGMRDAAAAFL